MVANRPLPCCRIVMAAIMLSIAPSGSYAQIDVYPKLDPYHSKRLFFETSPFGTLALMPNVRSPSQAKLEHQYMAFPKSGSYDIPARSEWWFVVNHRKSVAATDDYTYVGVFIARLLSAEQIEPLKLQRNEGWYSGQDLDAMDEDFISWSNFFVLQDSDAEEAFRQEYGEWHALPDSEARNSSWFHRDRWLSDDSINSCFGDVIGQEPDSSFISYRAHLIRFQVTSGVNTQRPVAWNVAELNMARGIFVKTFSPEGVGLNLEYCLALR